MLIPLTDSTNNPSNLTVEKDPLDEFWEKYLEAMKHEDETRPHDWEGHTTGILTFVRVFRASRVRFT